MFDQHKAGEPFFRHLSHVATRHNTRLVCVGGVVRDMMLARPLVDVDLMVDHPAQDFVTALAEDLHGSVVFHQRFLTYTISTTAHQKIDVATAREETYPQPGKLPVVTPSTIENDLKRRDFTINAIACWLTEDRFGTLLDPFEGKKT